ATARVLQLRFALACSEYEIIQAARQAHFWIFWNRRLSGNLFFTIRIVFCGLLIFSTISAPRSLSSNHPSWDNALLLKASLNEDHFISGCRPEGLRLRIIRRNASLGLAPSGVFWIRVAVRIQSQGRAQ